MQAASYSFIATIFLITWSYVIVRMQSVPIDTAIFEAVLIAAICAILYFSSLLIRRLNATLA
jgi:hypothetical protein